MIEYFSYYQVTNVNSGKTVTGLSESEARKMKNENDSLILIGPFIGQRSGK